VSEHASGDARRETIDDTSDGALDERLLATTYAAYNAQDLNCLLAVVSDDVDWPVGPHTPRRLRGKDAVRAYWSEQWTRTRTRDTPVRITRLEDGRLVVRIEQVVRALDGPVLSRGAFDHVHRIRSSRIARMDMCTDLPTDIQPALGDAQPQDRPPTAPPLRGSAASRTASATPGWRSVELVRGEAGLGPLHRSGPPRRPAAPHAASARLIVAVRSHQLASPLAVIRNLLWA